MQERRTTVRVAYPCRAQYCAADDLLPRDGRILNLSERGAGMLVRESRREGEQVTTSFSLPGTSETLTATGVVRWSSPTLKGRWHAMGLEWLPLEEATRNRLHTFLYTQPIPSTRGRPDRAADQAPSSQWMVWGAWGIAILLVGAVAWLWAQTLQREQEARWLRKGVEQRSMAIAVLKQREQRLVEHGAWLQQELGTAQHRLASATGEMVQLDQQAQSLAGDAQRLRQEVELFQQSYDKAQQERGQLIQEVIGLEQERLKLLGRLSSLPELHLAIRNAIEARKAAQAHARWAAFQTLRGADTEIAPEDNQGFVIRDGRSTLSRRGTVMMIRVHDPQAAPASSRR